MQLRIMARLPDPAFRAIAERLQTRPSLFIEDRLQYEADALSFLEEKKAEAHTLVAHQCGFIPSGEN